MSLNDAQQLFGFFFAIYFFMIIDRSHVMHRAWDTYSTWQGKSHTINRLLVSRLLLVILPVTHFAVLFTLLGLFNVTFDPTMSGVVSIVLISLGSFFSFGYFRVYEAVIHRYPEFFISDDERRDHKVEIRPHFRAHFMPGMLYIVISTLMLMVSLYL